MKLLKSLMVIVLFTICLPVAGQAPTFDEMEFEHDSLRTAYKPGKNFAFIRSKRGTSGVNKTPVADAILSSEVTEIVLVYTETQAGDIAEREEANKERWENLLQTYPELFQFSTTYKNVCQCNMSGDAEVLKKTQGFYVYINGEVPKMEEPKTEEPVAATPVKTQPAPPIAAPTAKTVAKEEVAAADKTSVKTKEAPVKETPAPAAKEPVKETVKETPKPIETVPVEAAKEEPADSEPEVVKETPRKKTTPAVAKPRRAKDPKACRPPCYENGDDDLIAFFKNNITLDKKQKRKAKNWIANVRLQINFDGTIKKAMVTGTEPDFNQIVQDALKAMNNWNPAVKSGMTVKSEIRFNLKYDKDSKAMRPSDFNINPRPTPKCQCASDSEIFGD